MKNIPLLTKTTYFLMFSLFFQVSLKSEMVAVDSIDGLIEQDTKEDRVFMGDDGRPFTGTASDTISQYGFGEIPLYRSLRVKEGRPHGRLEVKFDDGNLQELSHYKNGKLHGDSKTWWSGSDRFVRTSYTYNEGTLHGSYFVFHSNGEAKEAGSYANGLKHGNYRKWYDDGNLLIECNYSKDVVVGLYREWSRNGQLIKSCNYNKKGEAYGVLKEWYDDGKLRRETNYKNGIRHGSRTSWYWSGKKSDLSIYDNGKLVSKKEWDEKGSLIAEVAPDDDANTANKAQQKAAPSNVIETQPANTKKSVNSTERKSDIEMLYEAVHETNENDPLKEATNFTRWNWESTKSSDSSE